MSDLPVLFAADVVGVIKITILVIFGIVMLINKLIKMAGGDQKGPQSVRRPAAKQVDDEIEAFLRRAAQARNEQVPPPQSPFQQRPPAPARAVVPPPIRSPQRPAVARGTAVRPTPPPVPRPAQAQRPIRTLDVSDEETLGKQSVQEHVSQHLDNREFSERAAHLTNVDQVVGELEQHIHQSLDHKLGQLTQEASAQPTSGQPGNVAPAVIAAAAGISQMMANPAQLRTAIIMNEIFQRPTGRWE